MVVCVCVCVCVYVYVYVCVCVWQTTVVACLFLTSTLQSQYFALNYTVPTLWISADPYFVYLAFTLQNYESSHTSTVETVFQIVHLFFYQDYQSTFSLLMSMMYLRNTWSFMKEVLTVHYYLRSFLHLKMGGSYLTHDLLWRLSLPRLLWPVLMQILY